MSSLSKRDQKIANQGASKSSAKWRARGRSERMTGVLSALGAAKADSAFGDMLPTVNVPMLGETKVHALVGAAAALRYATSSKTPSSFSTAIGFAGLAVAVRAL